MKQKLIQSPRIKNKRSEGVQTLHLFFIKEKDMGYYVRLKCIGFNYK